MVAAAIRTIFAQPTGPLVRGQVDEVARLLEATFPTVADMLPEAKTDITAFADFPEGPLEEGVVDQPARAAEQGDQASHRRRRHLPNPAASAGSPEPSSSKPTTNGRPPTAATYQKPASPRCSPPPPPCPPRHRPRRWPTPTAPSHNQHQAEPPRGRPPTPRPGSNPQLPVRRCSAARHPSWSVIRSVAGPGASRVTPGRRRTQRRAVPGVPPL
jgi:hypothetical protein